MKVAVVLAGCGVNDGSEIHESVVTLLSLKRNGVDYDCFSLNKPQYHVINHLDDTTVNEISRNMMVESARIARGDVKNLESYDPNDYDAIIFPGGFGVAKNFFSFAIDGVDCKIDKIVQKAIVETYEHRKPIGAICISPVMIARAFKDLDVQPALTVGNSEELMQAVEKLGGIAVEKKVDEICFDEKNLIISCPAYTIANDIAEAASGIEKLVKKIINI